MTDLLRNHTDEDVANLTSNYDVWVAQLRNGFTAIQPKWVASDSVSANSFSNDLGGLESRYGTAKSNDYGSLSDVLTNPLTGGMYTGGRAEAKYQAIIKALHQGGEGSPPQPGDFEDLTLRLAAEQAKLGSSQTKYVPTRQPSADADSDISLFKKLAGLDVIGNQTARKAFTIPLWGKVAIVLGLTTLAAEAVGLPVWSRAVASRYTKK